MKRICLLLALALVPSQFCSAALVITEVMSSSGVTGDWWELTNTGATSVDLTGYYWDDNGPNGADGALFGSFVINSGQSIIISDSDEAVFAANWGNGLTILDTTFFAGSDDAFSGLSSGGDQIELWDANPNLGGNFNLVARVDFGAATTGFSFEWDLAGNSLGLSVAGENGAFVAGGDVGSPGLTAVPEPGTMAALAFGSVGLFLAGRRQKKALKS